MVAVALVADIAGTSLVVGSGMAAHSSEEDIVAAEEGNLDIRKLHFVVVVVVVDMHLEELESLGTE